MPKKINKVTTIGKMKYYKLQFGYEENEYLPITGDELPKALALFMEKTGRAIFENGAMRGQDIMRITPDWHTAKGWNKGYKMQPEDFKEIELLEEKYKETYDKARYIAEYAIKENRLDLLAMTPQEAFKELPKLGFTDEVKFLADKLKIQ